MKKMLVFAVAFVISAHAVPAQTLTFLLRNPQVIPGPKFQYEVWVKSSDGTSRMGSILVYNNYNTLAFGVSVASSGSAVVTKNSSVFGSSYGQNPTNDNTGSRFAYSWTYLGGAGSGVVIPSTGDGVLAFTVQINIVNTNQHAGLTFEQSLMDGEQYKDDEMTPWPVVDASDFVDPPLPIQLASFTAQPEAHGHGVLLDWTTLSEINNFGFEVQRSPVNDSSYATLPNSFVAGHGTSNEPHHYTFIDSTASPGRWYYRLRQIDVDGTVHFSNGVSVNTLTGVSQPEIPDRFALGQNYPNPFNPSTTITYQLPTASHVTLKIYNTMGQEVVTLIDDVEEAGYKSAVWNALNVSSGVYFYRLQTNDFVQTRKLVLMR